MARVLDPVTKKLFLFCWFRDLFFSRSAMQGTPMFAAIHDRGQVFPRTIFPLGAKFLIIPQPSASSAASQTSLRFGAERRRGLSRAEWGEMDCDEEDRQETGECVWSGVADKMGCQPRVFYEGGRGEWG